MAVRVSNLKINDKCSDVLVKEEQTTDYIIPNEADLNQLHYSHQDDYLSEADGEIVIEDSNESSPIVDNLVHFYLKSSNMDQSQTSGLTKNMNDIPPLDKNSSTDLITLNVNDLNKLHYSLQDDYLSEADNQKDSQIVKIEDSDERDPIVDKLIHFYMNSSPNMDQSQTSQGISSKNTCEEFNDLGNTTVKEESEDYPDLKISWVGSGLMVQDECDTADKIVDNKLLINFNKVSKKLRRRGNNGRRKQNNMPTKRRKKEKSNDPPKLTTPGQDIFCWKCHRHTINFRPCSICPRIYHIKCSDSNEEITEHWICSECAQVPTNDLKPFGIEILTLSRNLSYVLDRVLELPESAPFVSLVNPIEHPDYTNYIVNPMCISIIQNNIDNSCYQCVEKFLADFKWILHNSYIYNTSASEISIGARSVLKQVVEYYKEIKLCLDCFFRKNIDQSPNWFIETCKEPHLMIWAKLQGHPYWPSKMLASTKKGIEVKFFGDHDKAVVPVKFCYLFSKHFPVKSKLTPRLAYAINEAHAHIKYLKEAFIKFSLAPDKIQLNLQQLPIQKSEQFPFLYRSETEMIEIGHTIKMSPSHLSSEKFCDLSSYMTDDLYDTTCQDPETDPLALDSISEPTSYAHAKPDQLEEFKLVKSIESYYSNAQIMHTNSSTVTIKPLKLNCIEENIEKPETSTIYVEKQCTIAKRKEIQIPCNIHVKDSVINLDQVFYKDNKAVASLTPETEVGELNPYPEATTKSLSFITNDFNEVNIPYNVNSSSGLVIDFKSVNSTSTMKNSHDTNIKQSISCNPTKSNKLLLAKTTLSSSGSKIDIKEIPTLINKNNIKIGNSSMKCQKIKNFQGLTNHIQNTVDFKQNIDKVGQQEVLKTQEHSSRIPRTFVSPPDNSTKHHTSHPPKHSTDIVYETKCSKTSEASTIKKKLKTTTFSGSKRYSETQSSNTNNQNHNVESCSTKRKCTAPVIASSSEYLKNLFDKISNVPGQTNGLSNYLVGLYELAATNKNDDLKHSIVQLFESLVAYYDNSDDDEIESESSIEKKAKKYVDSLLEPAKFGRFCRVCRNEPELYCCQGTYYCSDQCQDLNWKTHQKTCAQDNMLVNDKRFRFNPKNRKKVNNLETSLNLPKGFLEYVYKTEIENKTALIHSKGESIRYIEKNNSMSEKTKDSPFNDEMKKKNHLVLFKNSISDNSISSWNQPSCSSKNDEYNHMPHSKIDTSFYTSDGQLVSSQLKNLPVESPSKFPIYSENSISGISNTTDNAKTLSKPESCYLKNTIAPIENMSFTVETQTENLGLNEPTYSGQSAIYNGNSKQQIQSNSPSSIDNSANSSRHSNVIGIQLYSDKPTQIKKSFGSRSIKNKLLDESCNSMDISNISDKKPKQRTNECSANDRIKNSSFMTSNEIQEERGPSLLVKELSNNKHTNVPVDLRGSQRKTQHFIKTNKNINPTTIQKNINGTLVTDAINVSSGSSGTVLLISSDPSNTTVKKSHSYYVLNSAGMSSSFTNQAIYAQVSSGISQQSIHVPCSKKIKTNSAEPLYKTVRKLVPIRPKPTANNGRTFVPVAVRKFIPNIIKPNQTINDGSTPVSVGCTAPKGSLSTFTIAGRKRPFSEGK